MTQELDPTEAQPLLSTKAKRRSWLQELYYRNQAEREAWGDQPQTFREFIMNNQHWLRRLWRKHQKG